MNFSFLFKTAWRDSRKNRGRLLLFTGSIFLGISALVAINSFSFNLKNQIETEAKQLLGADLEVKSRQAIPDSIYQLFDSLGMQMSREISFASMIYFEKSNDTRLVDMKAVEKHFPFYGKISTSPDGAVNALEEGRNALVDQTLMLQFGAENGDPVKIGDLTFTIQGKILSIPGQAAIRSGVAPPVFFPYNLVEETGLLQKGSRINYKVYLKYPEGFTVEQFKEIIKPKLEAAELSYDDIAERKEELGEAYSNMSGFLNLTAFVALLLGCIGVASSAHIYIKGKVESIAVLRCLGATGNQSLLIYLIQISIMSFFGSLAGAVFGSALQWLLPSMFESFLPFDVTLQISWLAVIQGVFLGVLVAVLFALTSLLQIRQISPLKVLRASYESSAKSKGNSLVYVAIVVLIFVFSWFQLSTWWEALIFTMGLFFAFGLLTGFANLIMWLLRNYFPVQQSMILRQSVSNLYRPNNQTLVLIVSIGLGTALISTLFMSQDMLLDKIKFSSSMQNRPNMLLFDIQDGQKDELHAFTDSFGLPILQEVPIVNMRLHSINGLTSEEIKKDTTIPIKKWVMGREYRVTYRDSLSDSETLTHGKWRGKVENQGDSIFISLAQRLAEDMPVKIGSPIVFNVQGALITTYVGSIRKIDWQRLQTNFLIVFPEGVLEAAPKFHVMLTRYDSIQQSAQYQRDMVQKFPNVSIIDLSLVLSTVDNVISRVSFVIRFMAFLSIFTGLIVLIGSVLLSKYQRLSESVLLRTLGASQFQILSINALEYFILGSLASLSGIFIALACSWGLSWYSFDAVFAPSLWPILLTYFGITGITVLIGLSNSREIINKAPLEILRGEE